MQRGVFTWRALLAVRTLARSEAKLRALQKERRRLVRELRKVVEELGPQCVPPPPTLLPHLVCGQDEEEEGAHPTTRLRGRLGPEIWEHRVISPEELDREDHEKNKPVFYKRSSYIPNTVSSGKEDKKDK
jgi:hypothetical protein